MKTDILNDIGVTNNKKYKEIYLLDEKQLEDFYFLAFLSFNFAFVLRQGSYQILKKKSDWHFDLDNFIHFNLRIIWKEFCEISIISSDTSLKIDRSFTMDTGNHQCSILSLGKYFIFDTSPLFMFGQFAQSWDNNKEGSRLSSHLLYTSCWFPIGYRSFTTKHDVSSSHVLLYGIM